ncbi:hypothetical protein J2D73_18625 [Acetobacter sacchari]|uniref:Uncharacterized protein n=1 Tax=Acetobacter sacchari TaxID=2661687 RepID=A0ABS3M122_9PROT|nr:hypothetical protein [Acetobacter sacchari]MBO1361801.1 hypothetical protein [Acetobacter sacchari]
MESSEPTGKRCLTRAQRRALNKASLAKFIMIDGAFSGVSSGCHVDDPSRDARSHIERLVSWKLLWPGEGFNQYVITDAGRNAISKKRRSADASS